MKFYECAECGARIPAERVVCPNCGKPAEHQIPTDMRCECGFLLCKLTLDAIEVKCRRCKRLVSLPILDLRELYQERKSGSGHGTANHGKPEQKQPGQRCSTCGKIKQSVVYGKCLECRTEAIKIQYKSQNK